MAKKEQMEILKQGVEVWNRWREENPGEEIDLSGADLRRANLTGAILSDSKLSGADLRETDLFYADLRGANFFKADLRGTDLAGADLWGAKYIILDQISKVKTLYLAKLNPELEQQIREKYPHLLEKPEDLKEEK
jgi:hypothetical protein